MFGFGNKVEMPPKPVSHDEQMDMVWIAIFNHIPSQLGWINTKMSFVLAFMTLVLGLTAISLGVIVALVI